MAILKRISLVSVLVVPVAAIRPPPVTPAGYLQMNVVVKFPGVCAFMLEYVQAVDLSAKSDMNFRRLADASAAVVPIPLIVFPLQFLVYINAPGSKVVDGDEQESDWGAVLSSGVFEIAELYGSDINAAVMAIIDFFT